MNSKFSTEEKRKFMLKKHIQTHLFEYVLDFIGPLLLTILILYFCKVEEGFIYGIILSVAYSTGKTMYSIHRYKKKYIGVNIK